MTRAAGALVLLLVAGGCSTACRTLVDPAAIQDAQTAARVKTALVNDPGLGATTIEVSVVGGVARLSGTLPSAEEVARAETLARRVPGVRDVQLDLQVVRRETPAAAPPAVPPQSEFDNADDPRLLALGASIGWSGPRVATFGSRLSFGPLVRLGSGSGFGPALALNWFQTTLSAGSSEEDVTSRIHLRPIMAGIGYTWASDRVSISPSIVGGVAFNSLTAPETGTVGRIAVEVGNSVAWRPGVSIWLDVDRRIALNLSLGYVVTRIRVTFLEGQQLVRQDIPADTTIIHAGVAYKLF